MFSRLSGSKREDLINSIIGGTISNILPMLILGLIAGLGRFLLGTADTILFLTTAVICIGVATLASRRRVQSRRLSLSKIHASGLILLTIATCFGLSFAEPWCSYEPMYFYVNRLNNGAGYDVIDNQVEIEQNGQLEIKLVANSKIDTKETLDDGFTCEWTSADETRIRSTKGCYMQFSTNITPAILENNATVEFQHKSCKRRESVTLTIALQQ